MSRRMFSMLCAGCVAASAWGQCPAVESGRFVPSSPAPNQFRGSALAIRGQRAVVGLPESVGNGFVPAGAVTVHVWTGASWGVEAQLQPPAGSLPGFGASVAIDGDTIAVGAPGVGRVYVFAHTGGSWSLAQTIDDPGPHPGGRFGREVALSGDVLAASTPSASSTGVAFAGVAHVFRRAGTSYVHEAMLPSPNPVLQGFFGSSIAASGDTVLVGSYGDSVAGATAGAGYVFRRTGTAWTLEAALRGMDTSSSDALGMVCALDGDTAALGAFLNDTPAGVDAGSVYVFTRHAGAWSQQAALHGASASANFGSELALDGDTLLVGAALPANAVSVVRRSGSTWTTGSPLTPVPLGTIAGFGKALAIDGSIGVVGAPDSAFQGQQRLGVALAYDLAPPAPVITQHPAPSSATKGEPVTMAVQVAAIGPVAYQWRRNGVAIPNFPPFSGASGPSLTIDAALPVHAGEFDVVVTTFCGTLTSTPATLGVTIPCPVDLTTTAVPGSPGFGVPNGVLTNDDFFYYLTLFAAGC